MSTWSVFIDETGPLYEPSRSASLVGLVLEGYPTSHQRRILQERLRRAFPGLRYPVHANRTHWASAWVEGALLDAPGASAGAQRAAEWFRTNPADEARALVQAGPREASAEVLKAANRRLRRDRPDLYVRVEADRQAARAAADALLAELGASCAAFVVAAKDPPSPGESATARYERVLGGLVERVVQILRGPRALQLVVRTARFRHDVRGGPTVAAARDFPVPGQPPVVQLKSPERYDTDVHPGIVLADLVANRICDPVLAAPSWRRARAEAEPIGLSVERSPAFADLPPLPTLAYEGLPRDLVTESFAQGARPDVVALGTFTPRWAAEQAQAWIDAVTP